MGAWGAIIMGFFGALFGALTLHFAWQVTGAVLVLPFLGFVGIAALAAYVVRLPGEGLRPSERGERAILWSSIGEGIGLFLAANIVVNLHRPDLLMPAMALVVGLHFLPIAHFAPFPPFHALGAALILAAIFGAITMPWIAGLGAGLGLWVAALMAVRRDWRAKRV